LVVRPIPLYQKYQAIDGKEEWGVQPNIGLGIGIKSFTLDYAFTRLGSADAGYYTHVFSLRFKLTQPKKKITMKRYLSVLILLLTVAYSAIAQSFGNEWINYSQSYYSFPIVQSGIHSISYQQLFNAGIPVDNIPIANFQVFGKQKEQPLYIPDNGNNLLDPNELIYFYAEKNDGWLDSTLYDDPSWLGNPKYSLYNDTIHYFFSWTTGAPGLRFTEENDIDFVSYQSAPYLWFEKNLVNVQAYNEGEVTTQSASSLFVPGEGWGSTMQNGSSGYTWNYSATTLDNLFTGPGAPNVRLKSVIVGGSNAYSPGLYNHHTRLTIGPTNALILDTLTIGYNAINVDKQIPVSLFGNNGASNFKINIVGDLGVASDYQSVNYWAFSYPRALTLGGANKLEFLVQNELSQPKIRLALSNVNVNSALAFVFGTSPKVITTVVQGNSCEMLIPNDPTYATQKVVLQAGSTITQVAGLLPVTPTATFTNFAALPNVENALLFVYPKKACFWCF